MEEYRKFQGVLGWRVRYHTPWFQNASFYKLQRIYARTQMNPSPLRFCPKYTRYARMQPHLDIDMKTRKVVCSDRHENMERTRREKKIGLFPWKESTDVVDMQALLEQIERIQQLAFINRMKEALASPRFDLPCCELSMEEMRELILNTAKGVQEND